MAHTHSVDGAAVIARSSSLLSLAHNTARDKGVEQERVALGQAALGDEPKHIYFGYPFSSTHWGAGDSPGLTVGGTRASRVATHQSESP
eukprot:7588611-Heterocapsa_arctica.AAC.1